MSLDRRFAISFALFLGACGTKRTGPQPNFYFPPAAGAPVAAPQASAPPPAAATDAAAGYKGLGVESVPPELLAKYAAPPLSPDESRRINAMLDIRAPAAGVVSPDGKRLFFTWTITGTQQIFRLDSPMGFPAQLTGGEDTTSIAGLTRDGKHLLVSRDRSGEENPGLYVQSPQGGPLKVIQHKPKVQTSLVHLPEDPNKIYYRANDVTPESYAIYRYDLTTGQRETIFSEPGIWSVADGAGKGAGDRLLLEKSVGSNMTELFELDLATKKLTPLFGQGEREDYVAVYGAEAGEVLVLTPKLGDFRRLYSWKLPANGPANAGKGAFTSITPDLEFDVSSFTIDRAKKRILYSVNEAGYMKLFALDARTKQPVTLPKLPKGDHTSAGSTSPDGRFTSLSVDPGTSPPESFVFDWDNQKLLRWHRPATPEIDTSTFARATLESYPARDGTPIPMFVRRPAACTARTPDQGPCPVIVAFHGGPEAQTIAGFSSRAQLFVDAGFIYAEPNVRGSDGYGKAWLHADDGPRRAAILTDIEDASKFVRKSWTVGGKTPKVGIFGGSYGGYSTLVGMTLFAGAYDAGVSVVGISSLVTFLMNTAPYRRILRISEYGDPDKDRAALEQLSPIRHVDKVQAPLLLIQGATDPRVPVGEALQFHAALEKKGVPSQLIVFPDEGHGMRKRPNQVLGYGHAVRFFVKQLK